MSTCAEWLDRRVPVQLPELTVELELLLYGKVGHYARSIAAIQEEIRLTSESHKAAVLLQKLTRGEK